jgi:hypothetical protein
MNRVLIRITVLIGLVSAAFASSDAPKRTTRAEKIEAYQPYCGGARALTPCIREIIRVDEE